MTELRSHYDVVCVGGAMMGSSVAYFLTQNPDFDGSVLVVEPDWTYDNAQTTRAQNSIREQFTNDLNIRLSRFGIEFIEHFHENVQVDGVSPELNFRGTGYLFLADDEDRYAQLERESLDQLAAGAEVTMLRPDAISERFPYMDATQVVGARLGGMREGSFDGWALFQGIRRRAIHDGATYVKDRVVDIDVVDGRVRSVVLASGATVGADWVVNSAGCRAKLIAEMVGLELPVEPRARTSFVFDCRTPIDAIVPLTITPAGVHFRREQNHYMCGTAPDVDTAVDYDDLRARHDEFEDKIWPVLARYVPQFDQVHVVASWGGQYDYNTLDHNLVIGPGGDVENFLFVNGFSGHGLQQGPAVGRGVSEWITYGEFRAIDLRPLGYERIVSGTPIREDAVI
ncbi:NAD(P)/FAD-dependent oxidoreductase [Ilumatobacter coccineus]|uniref:Putative oxidoreductase n=1 Tax=Ilumatobacter coccineus (strain NBRC 103263 / KCTC 29153 / YM16-304) TaxID=1313172 RepID=A0A6C7EAT6_ILUCY|nr:FAD-binding oxidoreductase [Ilumatobacter coccineus]BAN02319.1 putative oxidoreductase [Ilumatobacter coccineus YM16-304]